MPVELGKCLRRLTSSYGKSPAETSSHVEEINNGRTTPMTLTASPDTLTTAPASEPSPAWYVRTSRDGGASVSGPYSTRGDADAARDAMEWITGRKFRVDSRAEPRECGGRGGRCGGRIGS